MRNILKETFVILNRNLWLLFLLMTVSYVGMIYFGILRGVANTFVELIIGAVTLMFIAVAGVAGFFNTLRATVDSQDLSDEEVSKLDLLKAFPKGVSEYFFPAFGVILIYSIVVILMFMTVIYVGKHVIGMFSFTAEDLSKALTSVEALSEFQKSIQPDDLAKLSKWHLLYVGFTSLMTYLLIYWLPEVFYNTKNALFAFFKAVQKAIMSPFRTLKLFCLVVLVNILTSVVMTLMLPFPLVFFLAYFVYFYGLLYVLMLIFNYYKREFSIPVVAAELVEEDTEVAEKDEQSDEE